MVIVETFCARCGRAADLSRGLCERCYDKLRPKFDELRDLDYDAQREIEKKYNVSDIVDAYILREFGKPSFTCQIMCNRCKCQIDYECQREYDGLTITMYRGESESDHLCKSCCKEIERDRERSKERDLRKFDSM